jgi:hypothetical protein
MAKIPGRYPTGLSYTLASPSSDMSVVSLVGESTLEGDRVSISLAIVSVVLYGAKHRSETVLDRCTTSKSKSKTRTSFGVN